MDAAGARDVWSRDTGLDQMYTALFRELLASMLEDSRRISANTQMLFMARAIERIGDRATNIAEIVRFLVGGVAVEEERHKADATKAMMGHRQLVC
jgi:phosphate transport system protein